MKGNDNSNNIVIPIKYYVRKIIFTVVVVAMYLIFNSHSNFRPTTLTTSKCLKISYSRKIMCFKNSHLDFLWTSRAFLFVHFFYFFCNSTWTSPATERQTNADDFYLLSCNWVTNDDNFFSLQYGCHFEFSIFTRKEENILISQFIVVLLLWLLGYWYWFRTNSQMSRLLVRILPLLICSSGFFLLFFSVKYVQHTFRVL